MSIDMFFHSTSNMDCCWGFFLFFYNLVDISLRKSKITYWFDHLHNWYFVCFSQPYHANLEIDIFYSDNNSIFQEYSWIELHSAALPNWIIAHYPLFNCIYFFLKQFIVIISSNCSPLSGIVKCTLVTAI